MLNECCLEHSEFAHIRRKQTDACSCCPSREVRLRAFASPTPPANSLRISESPAAAENSVDLSSESDSSTYAQTPTCRQKLCRYRSQRVLRLCRPPQVRGLGFPTLRVLSSLLRSRLRATSRSISGRKLECFSSCRRRQSRTVAGTRRVCNDRCLRLALRRPNCRI